MIAVMVRDCRCVMESPHVYMAGVLQECNAEYLEHVSIISQKKKD